MATGGRPINPAFYYGVIEGAVRDRATTADLWSRIRDQAEAAGLASPGLSLRDANRMRASAARTRTADTELGRADPNRALDSSMISRANWARDTGRRDAAPTWQVRFRHTFIADGVQQTEWRNMVIRGSLPATVEALARRVERAAVRMAGKYEVEHVDVDDLSILEL